MPEWPRGKGACQMGVGVQGWKRRKGPAEDVARIADGKSQHVVFVHRCL
jgi:hypothetical protein